MEEDKITDVLPKRFFKRAFWAATQEKFHKTPPEPLKPEDDLKIWERK